MTPTSPPSLQRRRLIALATGLLVAAGAGAVAAIAALSGWLVVGCGLTCGAFAAWIVLAAGRPTIPDSVRPPPESAISLPSADPAVAPSAPLSMPLSPAQAPAQAPVQAPASPPLAAEPRHVLVVDDNGVNQLVELELLRHMGFTVSVATNGRDALAHIERTADHGGFPALVLMDCQMPVMDGFAAARAWRQRERDGEGLGHLPIIAVTANALTVTLAQCEMAGMDGLLIKPLTTDHLITAIRGVLPNWTPAAPIPRASNPSVLERLRAATSNPHFVSDVIAIFIADAELQLRALTTVAEQGDAHGLARAAHKLKGASLAVGMEEMADLCGRIDALAEAGHISEAQALVPQLATAFARGRTTLLAYGG